MATQGIQGLFGGMGTPEEMQNQLAEQKAMQFAAMSPQQQTSYNIYKNTSNLGRGLAGAMGVDVQDPAVRRATMLRQMASQFDTNTPEGLRQMAQAVQGTDPELGFQIMQRAQAMETQALESRGKEADILSKTTTAKKTQQDMSSVGQALALAKTGKYTSESITDYLNGKGELVSIDKEVKPTSEFVAIANELGYGAKPTYGGYTPEQTAKVNAELQNRDVQKRIAGANRMSVVQQQESSFAKERGSLQAKSLAEAEAQAKAATSSLNRLSSMEALNKGTLISGPLAGTAIGASQFLSSVGLLSPAAAQTLASSEVYDKQAKDLVMQDLNNKLGGGVSVADLKFVEARIPQLINSQQARKELIEKLKEINTKKVKYYQSMAKEANTKGHLNEFDFSQEGTSMPPAGEGALGTKTNPIKLQ